MLIIQGIILASNGQTTKVGNLQESGYAPREDYKVYSYQIVDNVEACSTTDWMLNNDTNGKVSFINDEFIVININDELLSISINPDKYEYPSDNTIAYTDVNLEVTNKDEYDVGVETLIIYDEVYNLEFDNEIKYGEAFTIILNNGKTLSYLIYQ